MYLLKWLFLFFLSFQELFVWMLSASAFTASSQHLPDKLTPSIGVDRGQPHLRADVKVSVNLRLCVRTSINHLKDESSEGLQPGLSLTGPDWLDSFDLLSNYLLVYRDDGFGLCFIRRRTGWDFVWVREVVDELLLVRHYRCLCMWY